MKKQILILSLVVLAIASSCEKVGKKYDCKDTGEMYTAIDLRSSDWIVDGHELATAEKAEIYFYWESIGKEASKDEDWDKEDWEKDDYDKSDKEGCKGDWSKKEDCDKSGDKSAFYKFVVYLDGENSLKAKSENLLYESGTYTVDDQLNIIFYPKESDVQMRNGRFDATKKTLYLTKEEGHTSSDLTFQLTK